MRYVLYCHGRLPDDPYPRILVPIFDEAHQARTFVEEFVGADEYRRGGDRLYLPDGFILRAQYLTDILNTKLEGWELPERKARWAFRFRHSPAWDGMGVVKRPVPPTDSAPRVERERRSDRPPGFVTITDLCNASGILPMHARAALRAEGLEKPPYGWAFDPKDVPRIREICGIK